MRLAGRMATAGIGSVPELLDLSHGEWDVCVAAYLELPRPKQS